MQRIIWSRLALAWLAAALSLSSVAADKKPAPRSVPDAARPAGVPIRLKILPPRLELAGPRSEQQLVVLGEFAGGRIWDLTAEASFRLGDPGLARVDQGVLRPLANGELKIEVEAAGGQETVACRIHDLELEEPVSFTTEVVPVLTKLGCNQGACHGSQHGKGGFRLSLFGFDPEFDHAQIVKSAEGRRIVPSDPEQGLFLQKPTAMLEHGGGERLKQGSEAYALLLRWLEDGAPEPRAADPTVETLEVFPDRRQMQPGERQQLSVRARWSNGRVVDVTRTAQYDSLNDGLAAVTPAGQVRCLDRGETWIMIRYQGQATVFPVTSPYAPPGDYSHFTPRNFIDEHLLAKWRSLGLVPSGPCSDAEFLRRICLDTVGAVPTIEEVKAFLADSDPGKRAKAIEWVLGRPEFVDFWALKWGDLLRINRDALQEKGMWSLHNWVRAALRDGKPADEFARDIVLAEGSTFTEGPANYYRIGNTPADWAETTSQVFLGVRIQCARCHHHPFEKWSQDDYYGMAAFFARMGTKTSQEFGLFGRETVVHVRPTGEQTHPRKGGVVKPRPLGGSPLAADGDAAEDRRRALAEWMTAKDNSLFSRNLVNRFWGYYMGRGLVEPLDDMRATNPATNPELLDALARDFADHGFDFKHLFRTIMTSAAYQLSAVATNGNQMDKDNAYFARRSIKRLSAEQLADAVDFATGAQEKYQGLPLGTRAVQLPDSRVRSFLLDVFGRPGRQITCECERTAVPNLAQALHLANGDLINAKISRAGGRIDRLFQAKKPLPEIVEELYLATLSRPPRPEETELALSWIAKAPNPRAGAEDLLWALLNSRGFVFLH